MKNNVVLKIIIVIVVIVAIYIYFQRYKQAEERMKPKTEKVPPISVSTVTVKEEPIEEYVYATGTIRAVEREYCYFETSGKVIFLKQVKGSDGKLRDLKEGDRVKKGELLARLDSRSLEQEENVQKAMLREAEASLDKAKMDARRYEELWAKKATSKTEYEQYQLMKVQAEATVDTRKAKLKQAQVELEHSKIISPCDGIVAYMNVNVGYYFNSVSQNSARTESEGLKSVPFVILHDDTMELTADVPAAYTDIVKVGQRVYLLKNKITNDEINPGKEVKLEGKIEAEVYSVNPAIDPGGRSVRIKIRAEIPKLEFRDGQYLGCWIVTKRVNNALILPYNALLFQDNQPYCFVAKDGVAERRVVKTGIESQFRIQIVDGVKAGEKVVLNGNHRLVNGTAIVETGSSE